MRFLYVENFRGFPGTRIPIKDVNFLVGENSTGKSSILTLINIMSKPSFWFEQEFNAGDAQLGGFADIVSPPSRPRDTFRIGFVSTGKKDQKPSAFLLTFGNDKGMPLVKRYQWLHGDTEIDLLFRKSRTCFRGRTLGTANRSQAAVSRLFNDWLRKRTPSKLFREFPKKYPFSRQGELVFVPAVAEALVRHEKADIPSSVETPRVIGDLSWFGPIRSKPRRVYSDFISRFSSDGAHAPYYLRQLLRDTRDASQIKTRLKRYGRDSGLLDGVNTIDMGPQPTAPFTLNVEIGGISRNIMNVGYGIPQCLPILIELLVKKKGGWYAIQQPEIHLHPKAQAAIGGLVYSSASELDKGFLIETHSDYLIDRFRLHLRKGRDKVSAQVLFFERRGGSNSVWPIEISPDGTYSREQPKGFRDFFIREEMDMLGLR